MDKDNIYSPINVYICIVKRIRFILATALLLLSVEAGAQAVEDTVSFPKKAIQTVGDILNGMQEKFLTKVDTNYIGNYAHPWRAMLMYNASNFSTASSIDGMSARIYTSATQRFTIGLGYQGLALNYSYRAGKNRQTETSVLAYARAVGFELKYYSSNQLHLEIKTPEGKQSTLLEGFRYSTILIDGYWALNPRRFSFPAALSQSKRQKRSAGSPLIGAAITMDSFDVEDQESLQTGDVSHGVSGQILLGAGYGYNWVPGGGRLVVHASMIPMVTLRDAIITQYKDQEQEVEHLDGFSMTGLGRFGVFYYFSDRFYSGFILTDRLCGTWEKDKPFVSENSWYLRLPLIYRF